MGDKKMLVNGQFLLKKFPGKGGWTYAEISQVPQNKDNPFGWVRVSGSIDDYPLKQYKLMPMGNGRLFLPVKAEIRRKLGKQEGDTVHVILYEDNTPVQVPDELMDCFRNESSSVYETFMKFSEGKRQAFIKWIYEAKHEETKVKRIAMMMQKLSKGKGLWED